MGGFHLGHSFCGRSSCHVSGRRADEHLSLASREGGGREKLDITGWRKKMGLRGARAIIAIASHRETSTSLSNYLLRPKFFCPPSRRTRPLLAPFQTGGGPRMIRSVDEATGDFVTSKGSEVQQQPDDWKVKILYDGDCPLCMREVNMLRERNRHYRTIKFVDISSEDYSPQQNQGLDYETVMGRIHAIMSDGTVVTDVEAFRKLYEQVGLGWVYAITKYKPIAAIADAVYGVWAKYRLQITGRPGLEKILEARKQNKVKVCCDNQNCKI